MWLTLMSEACGKPDQRNLPSASRQDTSAPGCAHYLPGQREGEATARFSELIGWAIRYRGGLVAGN